eukprot:TRINITY_DN1815_c0_g1_i2.p1 TRINITY_DN1815_c0_g1~~TRINITY_DN1815_c0_g1_i2.p1  ORF type:complete len:486 (-),score=99.69 TRINITY_DN1815_c0_g1_i2:42-1499(-)
MYYALLSIDKQQRRSASVHNRESTFEADEGVVEWDQSFKFDVSSSAEDELEVRIWRKGNSLRTEFCGYARIPLRDVKESHVLVENFYPMETETGEQSEMLVKLGLSYSVIEKRKKTNVHDFELLKIIGQGTFGRVYQVKKSDSGNIYAMKVLRKDYVIQTNAVKYTMMENEILRNLNHPFILGLKYSFQTRDHLYMVTDYLGGGELFFHLNNEDFFTEERVKLYSAQIVLALSYLHENGVIYRDLKPENLLLDIQGNLCLIDFGLSKTGLSEGERTSTFCGSKEYIPPEMLEGKSYGKEIDWWALGIVVYELIDGNPPFWDENEDKMFRDILTKTDIDFPDYFSDDCVTFIIDLLCRNPFNRLGSGPEGTINIQNHVWFRDIDWVKVYKKEYTPEFKPHVSDITDVSHFDKKFTDQYPLLSYDENALNSFTDSDMFQGFSYDGTPGHKRLREEEKKEIRRKKMKRHTSSVSNPPLYDDLLFDFDI